MRAMPRLKAQGTQVFGRICGIVKNLEEDAVVMELVKDLKRNHAGHAPASTKEQFEVCSFRSFFDFFLIPLDKNLSKQSKRC